MRREELGLVRRGLDSGSRGCLLGGFGLLGFESGF